MKNKVADNPPVAVAKAYDFVLWLVQKVENFPKSHRFTIGERLVANGLDLLTLLVEASYTRQKRELLETASRKVNATRMLLPHIQRSVRIARRIGEAELSVSSARAALDAAPSAILMCDAALRLTYANAQGEAMIREGYLAVRGGRLVPADRKVSRRLIELAEPGGPHRTAAIALEQDGLPPVAAVAVRIEAEAGQGVNPEFGAPRIMIVAGRNHKASFANVDHLRDWFGLTPAEARLAATLAEGGSLDDFAQTRGITANASRFLLKGIFAKTDTHRQPQLVARLQATPLQWHIGAATPELPSPVG